MIFRFRFSKCTKSSVEFETINYLYLFLFNVIPAFPFIISYIQRCSKWRKKTMKVRKLWHLIVRTSSFTFSFFLMFIHIEFLCFSHLSIRFTSGTFKWNELWCASLSLLIGRLWKTVTIHRKYFMISICAYKIVYQLSFERISDIIDIQKVPE